MCAGRSTKPGVGGGILTKHRRSKAASLDIYLSDDPTMDASTFTPATELGAGEVFGKTGTSGNSSDWPSNEDTLIQDLPPYDLPFDVEVPGRRRLRSVLTSSRLIYGGLLGLAAVILLLTLNLVLGVGGDSPCAAAERFVQGLNQSNQQMMQDALSSRWRGDLGGFLSSWGTGVLLTSGVKVSDHRCTQLAVDGNSAGIKLVGRLSWNAQVGAGDINLGSEFTVEVNTIQIERHWYLERVVSSSLGDSRQQ